SPEIDGSKAIEKIRSIPRVPSRQFTLILCPLSSLRLSFSIMAWACSDETSASRWRSRTSIVPTTFPGDLVFSATALTTSIGTTPMASPTFIHRRVCSTDGRRPFLNLPGFGLATEGFGGGEGTTTGAVRGGGGTSRSRETFFVEAAASPAWN